MRKKRRRRRRRRIASSSSRPWIYYIYSVDSIFSYFTHFCVCTRPFNVYTFVSFIHSFFHSFIRSFVRSLNDSRKYWFNYIHNFVANKSIQAWFHRKQLLFALNLFTSNHWALTVELKEKSYKVVIQRKNKLCSVK